MIEYLKSLLPRLQQFSKSLNHIENFVDKPWIFIDEEERRHTYIFQRDHSLIMSLNGQVQMGKWDYIAPAASLLIDRGKDKILLNHGFIDNGIMILRTDGSFEVPWMLINEKEVPDLDVESYLKKSFINHLKLKQFNVDGKTYYYSDPDNIGINSTTEFYDENLNKVSFCFKLNDNRHYEVNEGIVTKCYYTLSYKTDKGIVDTISTGESLSIGDSVALNGRVAPNSFYRLLDDKEMKGFTVEDGRVKMIKLKADYLVAIISLAIPIFFAIMAFILNKNSNAANSDSSSNAIDTSTIIDTATTSIDTTVISADTTASASGYSTSRFNDEQSNSTIDEPIYYTNSFYTIGSTEQEVIDVQGQPTSIMGGDYYKIYSYGLSSVSFTDGKVSGYSNHGNLKINITNNNEPSYNTNGYFTIGSTESEVLSAQGQPSSIMGGDSYKIYSYGLSSVSFTDGRVSGYSNQGNLRIKN